MRHLFLVFLLLFSIGIYGQVNDFRPGSITLTSGEKLEGYLNQDGRQTISKRIRFRSAPNSSDEITYSPRQITEAKFEESGRVFRPIIHQVFSVENDEKQEVPRIAEVLIEGPYTLYVLDRFPDEFYKTNSSLTNTTYYLGTGEDFHPLRVEERWVSDNEFNIVESFRGALNYYFRDWPSAISKVSKVKYTDTGLKELFRSYFQFKGVAVDEEDKSQGKTGGKVSYAARVLVSDFSKFVGGEFANIGGGAGVYWQNDGFASTNSISVEVGLEYLTTNYNTEGNRSSLAYRNAKLYRIPISGVFYFTRQGLIRPRAIIGGSLGLLQADFRVNGAFVFNAERSESRIYTTIALGLGVDVKNLILEVKYDYAVGFILGAGYRFGTGGS